MDLLYFNNILRERCGYKDGDKVLIGLSGGPDSLCLADMMEKIGIQVLVMHINHGIRPEADDAEVSVRNLSQRRWWKLFSTRVDCVKYAVNNKLSLESAARELRYKALFTYAIENQLDAVMTAHSADDQVETILMHLMRGSGMAGLVGMRYRTLPNPWSTTIPLMRPFLGFWRREILDYCHQEGLNPIMDPSNLENQFLRNRIRNELLPLMETYNPKVKNHIWSMANTISEDNNELECLVNNAWMNCVEWERRGGIAINLEKLSNQSLAIIRRLIRKVLRVIKPEHEEGFSLADVERMMDFIQQPTQTRQMEWIAGLWVSMESKLLIIYDPLLLIDPICPRISSNLELFLDIPGRIDLETGWALEAVWLEKKDMPIEMIRENPFRAILSGDQLQLPLRVRGYQPGDQFEPLGMPGKYLNLGDFFTNARIPKRVRYNIPLVINRDEIIWVCGVRPAHSYCLKESVKKVVSFKIFQLD